MRPRGSRWSRWWMTLKRPRARVAPSWRRRQSCAHCRVARRGLPRAQPPYPCHVGAGAPERRSISTCLSGYRRAEIDGYLGPDARSVVNYDRRGSLPAPKRWNASREGSHCHWRPSFGRTDGFAVPAPRMMRGRGDRGERNRWGGFVMSRFIPREAFALPALLIVLGTSAAVAPVAQAAGSWSRARSAKLAARRLRGG